MDAKLTLKLDRDTVAEAKDYARKNGSSLSRLVESLLRSVLETSRQQTFEKKRSKTDPVSGLYGSIPELAGLDVHEAVTSYLDHKYDADA